MRSCSLIDLPLDGRGEILHLENPPSMRRRLQDLGFTKGSIVVPLFTNSSLTAYFVKEAIIAIRHDDAALIKVIRRQE